MKMLRVKAALHPERSPLLLPLGQRFLLACYVLLLALVLPFICWGALADPAHPHRTPHFVFADPTPVNAPMDNATHQRNKPDSRADRQHGQHGQHGKMSGTVAASTTTDAASPQPADPISGRAIPTLLLFAILLLLLPCGWSSLRRDLLAFTRWVHSPMLRALYLPVPFPPPRLSLSFLMAIYSDEQHKK